MKIATTIAEVRAQVREWKQQEVYQSGCDHGYLHAPVWSKRPCSSATAR